MHEGSGSRVPGAAHGETSVFLCPSCRLELLSALSALCTFASLFSLSGSFPPSALSFWQNSHPFFKAPLKHPKKLCLVGPPRGHPSLLPSLGTCTFLPCLLLLPRTPRGHLVIPSSPSFLVKTTVIGMTPIPKEEQK